MTLTFARLTYATLSALMPPDITMVLPCRMRRTRRDGVAEYARPASKKMAKAMAKRVAVDVNEMR